MKMIFKLAYRNIVRRGVRTWLNVIVLSFSFVVIIWTQGIYDGMNEQASRTLIDSEYGGGQYWHEDYDPYNPLTLEKSHRVIEEPLAGLIEKGRATPILVIQATIYPEGRLHPVILKGINPDQQILDIPSQRLAGHSDELVALIGSRMAKSANLNINDDITMRWRDARGTFDAADARIVHIMSTNAQSIDRGQIWLPIDKLQIMAQMQNEATIVVVSPEERSILDVVGWKFRDLHFLLSDIRDLVRSKSVGASIFYFILLFLAMLAIFDTQILSIFRRRKEIGTLMALGMGRRVVIGLFTLEGSLHGVLAAFVGAIYGIPLLVYFAMYGWKLPASTDSYGFAISQTLYPVYSAGLIFGTTALILITVTIVSFLPLRKLANLKPTDALRGTMT